MGVAFHHLTTMLLHGIIWVGVANPRLLRQGGPKSNRMVTSRRRRTPWKRGRGLSVPGRRYPLEILCFT
jgi:hypothetical protein